MTGLRWSDRHFVLTIDIWRMSNAVTFPGESGQSHYMSSSIEHLTLREKLRDAARDVRELIEHLELGFVPKVHDLRKLTRQHDPASGATAVADVTVRSYVSSVLESDRFTAGLNDSLEDYLNSIKRDVSDVVSRGTGR